MKVKKLILFLLILLTEIPYVKKYTKIRLKKYIYNITLIVQKKFKRKKSFIGKNRRVDCQRTSTTKSKLKLTLSFRDLIEIFSFRKVIQEDNKVEGDYETREVNCFHRNYRKGN